MLREQMLHLWLSPEYWGTTRYDQGDQHQKGDSMRAETEAAVAAVRVALEVLRARTDSSLVISKGGRDLATGTDIASQAAIQAELNRRTPGIAFVGEEGEQADWRSHERLWLVDPLCGTRNFASGIRLYCVNVALVEAGVVTASAVGDGTNGVVYVAERGCGAWRNTDSEGRVLRAEDSTGIIPVEAGGPGAGAMFASGVEFVRRLLTADRWYVSQWGTSLGLAYLALGATSGFATFSAPSPLHFAAGLLLAEEAGAVATDEQGRPWSMESKAYVAAATPALHAELLAHAVESSAAAGQSLLAGGRD